MRASQHLEIYTLEVHTTVQGLLASTAVHCSIVQECVVELKYSAEKCSVAQKLLYHAGECRRLYGTTLFCTDRSEKLIQKFYPKIGD